MPYQNGRGFYGNQAIGNQTTLGELASMNRTDYGFSKFYENRPELKSGVDFNYDWRTINRPGIKEGQGALGAPWIPSPMRGVQKFGAATSGLTNRQYKRWNKDIGSDMTWGGLRRDRQSGVAAEPFEGGAVSAAHYSTAGHEAAQEAAASSRRQVRFSRVGGVASGASPGTPAIPGLPSSAAQNEEDVRQSLFGLASDIEGDNPGAVRRGMAAGVRKVGAPGSKVSTIPGAIGTVVGSTARSVGSAAVGKVGEAVKSRWAGAKAPGTQFPKPPSPYDDLPF